MKEMLNAKHEGCGGTFREWNIYEEIRCDKCRQGTKRYIYTKEEQFEKLKAENNRLKVKIKRFEEMLEQIRDMTEQYID